MKNRLATVLLLAGFSSPCVSARWLRWSAGEQPTVIPRETGAVPVSAGQGWTPKPTPPPGARKSDQDRVVEYLGRRQDASGNSPSRNTWTDEQTCGWFKGTSSSAFTCGDDFSCVTNEDHNVACGSGTYSPFFTVCLDHSAYLDGGCDDAGALTGCCQDSKSPACGTYIWTGSPTRSMYRCFESTQIISLLDLPQFVIDASISSSIAASKSSESERLKSLTASRASTAVPASTTADGSDDKPTSGGDEPAGAGENQGDDGNESGGDTTNNTTDNGDHKNTPAIIGGAVGGILTLIILCLVLCCLMRRRKRKNQINMTKKSTNISVSRAVYNGNNNDRGKDKKKGLLSWAWSAISEKRKNRRKVPPAGNKERFSSDTSRSHPEEAPWPLVPVAPSAQQEVPPPPSVLQKNERGANAYPGSRYPPAANSSSANPGPPSAPLNYGTERQQDGRGQQQQAPSTRDSTNTNTYPYLQRDVAGGSSVNDTRNPSHDGGGGFPPSQTQQFVVPMNMGAGVPAKGSETAQQQQHSGSTTAFYQQPQSTGGAPHNFTPVPNHYTNGSAAAGAREEDARGSTRSAAAAAAAAAAAMPPGNPERQFSRRSADGSSGRYTRAQFTGEGDVSDMTTRTSSVRDSRLGHANHGTVHELDSIERSADPGTSSTAFPRRQHSQNHYTSSAPSRRPSRRPTSRERATSQSRGSSSGGGGGLGAEASTLAMVGLSLDVTNNNTQQQQQQNQHYHHHHYAGTAASAPETRTRPRYVDSSTMTATSPSSESAAAGYPRGSGRVPAAAGFPANEGFETETEMRTGRATREEDGGVTQHYL